MRAMNPKQVRARARRSKTDKPLEPAEVLALMGKPIGEWDMEELARGRPRNKRGDFAGAAPKLITREVHEQALNRFKELVRTDMRSLTVKALETLGNMLENEEADAKGRPDVPANVKVDISKFLIEHLIGKPTQPIEADISIKLQGILGAVLVQPSEMGGYEPSSSHRIVEGSVGTDDDDEDTA